MLNNFQNASPSAAADRKTAAPKSSSATFSMGRSSPSLSMSADLDARPKVLFTPYFREKTHERQRELDYCLEQNIERGLFSRIVLLVDRGALPPITDPKVEVVRTAERPTYQFWVELSRQLEESHVSILANSGIVFDDTANLISEVFQEPKTFVALSRHEKIGESLHPRKNPQWSQDVWALDTRDEIPETLFSLLKVPLGVPRCDNKIAYLFKIHGWSIINPCQDVIIGYVHENQDRTCEKKEDAGVIGGVAYVHPTHLFSSGSKIEIDVWTLSAAQIETISINNSLEAWLDIQDSTNDVEDSSQLLKMPHNKRDLTTHVNPLKHALFDKNGIFRRVAQLPRTLPKRVTKRFTPTAKKLLKRVRQALSRVRYFSTLPVSRKDITSEIAPVICTEPFNIRSRPFSVDDQDFWQYPCITERRAYERHIKIPRGKNIDRRRMTIHVYLGLPWATYIDKQNDFPKVIPAIRKRVDQQRAIAQSHGFDLRVHTVCQHIHWKRMEDNVIGAGVTDLHLSHCVTSIQRNGEGSQLTYHSWPLFAVNFEDQDRSSGLEVAKPLEKKRFLASFIGAHMPHYRSKARLALFVAAKKDGGAGFLIEVSNLWHFNRNVYEEQMHGVRLSDDFTAEQQAACIRYNAVLSDSVFSFCPEGAGPNTLRLWESLAVGAIPVVIADDWVRPNFPNNFQLEDACIFVRASEISSILSRLRRIGGAEIEARQNACLSCYRASTEKLCFEIEH